jgi:hypothetical protein
VITADVYRSNGDTHGFTFHADWINGEQVVLVFADRLGWPSGMLVDAFEQCRDTLLGNFEACPLLKASWDVDKAYRCYAQGEVIAEVRFPRCIAAELIPQVIGLDAPIDKLPGNNPEFNSSRDSTSGPKPAYADYVETAKIVPVDAAGTGICNRTCHDYVV